jgi:hypothetical protein
MERPNDLTELISFYSMLVTKYGRLLDALIEQYEREGGQFVDEEDDDELEEQEADDYG